MILARGSIARRSRENRRGPGGRHFPQACGSTVRIGCAAGSKGPAVRPSGFQRRASVAARRAGGTPAPQGCHLESAPIRGHLRIDPPSASTGPREGPIRIGAEPFFPGDRPPRPGKLRPVPGDHPSRPGDRRSSPTDPSSRPGNPPPGPDDPRSLPGPPGSRPNEKRFGHRCHRSTPIKTPLDSSVPIGVHRWQPFLSSP